MLFTSSDEDVGAILQKYSDMEKAFEKNLLNISIRSEGRVSLTEVYQMPYLLREQFVDSFNEWVDEKNKKNSS